MSMAIKTILPAVFASVVVFSSFASMVTFHGGAGRVGGSCATVRSADGFRLLIDCGTVYGGEYTIDGIETNSGTVCGFAFNPKNYDHLLITHAHQDHAGRVPELFNAGFTGTVWTTEASRELLGVAWKSQVIYDACTVRDWRWTHEGKKAGVRVHWHSDCEWSKKISPERLGTYRGIFSDLQSHLRRMPRASNFAQACSFCQDLELKEIMKHVKTVPFEKAVRVGPFSVTFSAVKHLPGAASIRVTDAESSIIFSGDLGTKRSHLVRSIEPAGKADAVFIEATYGDGVQGTAEEIEREYDRFIDVVGKTVRAGGVAWIPAFALDRSQRIFFEVKRGIDSGIIPNDVPIYYLSPSSRDYMDLYVSHPQWFDEPEKVAAMQDLFKRTRKSFSTKAKLKKGAILITTSGNMTTGYSFKFMPELLTRETTGLCIVGYQTPGSYGHQLQQIARGVSNKTSLRIREGRLVHTVQVKAKVYDFNCFSGHGDARENDEWLVNNKDSRILLVHGGEAGLKERAEGLRKRFGIAAEIAEPGREYDFSEKKQ